MLEGFGHFYLLFGVARMKMPMPGQVQPVRVLLFIEQYQLEEVQFHA